MDRSRYLFKPDLIEEIAPDGVGIDCGKIPGVFGKAGLRGERAGKSGLKPIAGLSADAGRWTFSPKE